MTTIEKPRLSPIPFYPEDETVDERFNLRHMLSTWKFLTLRELEEKIRYFQKWQFEHIELQFHTLAVASTPELYLLDRNLNLVHTWSPMPAILLPGNLDPVTGGQLTTWHFRFTLAGLGIAEGIYFFRFKAPFASGDKFEISEPQSIRRLHPGTVLLQGSNDTNDYNFVFEQTAAQLCLRVEGDIKYQEPGATFESFTNVDKRTTKTYGKQGRTIQFNVGGNARRPGRGVPDWMFDKVDAFTILDHWRADGREFVREGEKWEKSESEGLPHMRGNISVKEANPDEATISRSSNPIILFPVPGSIFAISSVTIGVGIPNIELLPSAQVIDPATDMPALITVLDAERSAIGMGGTISISGGNVIYTPVSGEYYANGSAIVFPYYFSYTLDASGILATFSTSLVLRNARVVIDWNGLLAVATVGPSSYATLTNIFATGSTKTVRVFHDNVLQEFYVSEARRLSLTGTLPATMQTLFATGGSFTANTFDFSILNPCRNALQALTVSNSALTAANGFNGVYCPRLRTINFSGNALSKTTVGLFMYDVWFNARNHNVGAPITSGGTFSIVNQTPNANPLNTTGAINKARLTSSPFYWTVNN